MDADDKGITVIVAPGELQNRGCNPSMAARAR
jgi:hypothetical protein